MSNICSQCYAVNSFDARVCNVDICNFDFRQIESAKSDLDEIKKGLKESQRSSDEHTMKLIKEMLEKMTKKTAK
ncbi:MAG TPA: hypothetical protein VJH04_03155 [archaeon]|nr:hypothetical protein [archaeon]